MRKSVPTFQKKVSKAIVRRINSQVDSRLEESKLHDCNCEKKNISFQLFEKKDLQLGKRIGRGGFSDVYEVEGFNKARPARRSWTLRKDIDITLKNYKHDAADKNGRSKYVVKQLKSSKVQDPHKFCTAAADLVMEAHYLSSLNHENILSIRGWAAAGVEAYLDGKHDSYFLILDRLEDTLDKKLEIWQSMRQMKIDDGSCNLISRVKVAHQIASAVQYLHSKNIIFRDLKPNNVGFDEFGIVKIFDFGLCREMPEELDNVNDVYKMSGRIGTLRYMAPEVALSEKYNQKVDTYSWALLFWYCLSLSKPYPRTTRSQHLEQVCQYGVRPAINSEWSETIHHLLEKSWAHDPYDRFTMVEVCAHLERIEKELEIIKKTEKPISGKAFSLLVPLPTILVQEMNKPMISMAA